MLALWKERMKKPKLLKTVYTEEPEFLPYIKPTRHVHESGFRCFEVGYRKIGEDNRVSEKKVLGEYSDHIFTPSSVLGRSVSQINIDLTKDGYIRFFSWEGLLKWSMEYALSSMELILERKSK